MKRSGEPGQFPRFVAFGAANALVTYLIYLAALPYVGYAIAYTISYACGIAISYVANSMAVFRAPMSVRSAVRFPLVYVFQYVAGMLLMWILVDLLSVPAWIAPWIATILLIPASFLITRKALHPR